MAETGEMCRTPYQVVWVTKPASTSLYLAAGQSDLSPRCTVTGIVSSENDPQFHRPEARLKFVCGVDNRLSAYAEMHGVAGAYGSLKFAENLKSPELHDLDFSVRTFAPISAWVGVNLEQFRLLEEPPGSLAAISQWVCKRTEEVFGWVKSSAGFRQTKHRGRERGGWCFDMAATAYNMIRLPELLASV